MKKWVIALFLGIILLVSLSFVSAIQGVCTGTQTCYCSGKAVSCPCDADPCKICGPTSPECTGQTNQQNQNNQNLNQETPGFNTANPQTFGDYAAVLGNGFRNLFRTAMGEPSIVGGQVETSVPTTGERIVAVFAIGTMLLVVILIIKVIVKKSAMAGAARMSRAQPSRINSRKIPKRNKPGHGCFPIPKKK